MIRILLVEDDQLLSDSVKEILKQIGEVTQTFDGQMGLYLLEESTFDLVVLDVMLPQMNGYELLDRMHNKQLDTPVLLLTAKDSIEDKITGFRKGADDYLTKPFSTEELLYRVKAILKRTIGYNEQQQLSFGNVQLNSTDYSIQINQHLHHLPLKQFHLLQYFLQHPNQILPKSQIFDRFWGIDSESVYTIVEVYMSQLRKMLVTLGATITIKTLQNIGYILVEIDEDH